MDNDRAHRHCWGWRCIVDVTVLASFQRLRSSFELRQYLREEMTRRQHD
jgi:hypothetical protein